MGDALGKVGLRPSLEPDDLVRTAKRQTGLEDFGGDDWREPLERLVRSAQTDTELTPLGRHYVREDLVHRLSNRLRIHDAIVRDPEILAEPIVRPIFILGLPRSGTTHLHRLLAQDPQSRVLTTWEMADPVPPPRAETYETDPRIGRLERQIRFIHWAGPSLRAIHEFDARQPEECISLMANDLLSAWFAVGVDVRSYARWLLEQDLHGAYLRHRRQLQLLGRHFRRDRWVLKSPVHMHGLSALLSVYPDARIVWTHRDPAAVVPSAASLLYHFRSTLARGVERADTGRYTVDLLAGWVEQGVRARAAVEAAGGGATVFLDVAYDDIVRAPMQTVARIYEAFGLCLDADTRARMEKYLEGAVQHRLGVHQYRLEDFGLDRDQVESRFERLLPRPTASS